MTSLMVQCATIKLNDGTTTTCSAWVIVAPPDFAPGIKNIITLYDAIHDLAIQRGLLPAPTASANGPSFTQHVQPILARALGYRWVNRFRLDGLLEDKAHNIIAQGSVDLSRLLAELADPSPTSSELRTWFVAGYATPSLPTCPMRRSVHTCATASNIRRGRNWCGRRPILDGHKYKIMQAWAKGNSTRPRPQPPCTRASPGCNHPHGPGIMCRGCARPRY